VITLAIRTPLTKAKKGGFKDTSLEYLVFALLEQVRLRSNIDPALVEDICLGNVSDGKAAYKLRAASLAAGFPNTASASTVNRFCSSGLKATADIAHAISQGSIAIGVAMGAESMSAGGDALDQPLDEGVSSRSKEAEECMMPMGWTSENVSRDFGITREQMDAYAAESFQRAERAQKEGLFADEIVEIATTVKDKEGNAQKITVSRDEGVRPGTTAEGLGKVRAAFPQWGPTSTGGNSSQVTDGGKFTLLAFSHQTITNIYPSSCRPPPHEALHRRLPWPAHPREIRPLHDSRSRPPHHGHRPLPRHPQAPRPRRHRPR
jgi:acetyl-CoA acyltransferase 1